MEQIQNLQEENIRLRKAIEELSILNDLARIINSTMSLDVIMNNIIKSSVKAVHGEQGMITLVDEVSPTSMFTLVRTIDTSLNQKHIHLNQNILGWMLIHKKPLVSNNFPCDTRFSGVKVEEKINSVLCVPLLVKNRLIGILAIFNKKNDIAFTEDDTRLLSIIATQSAQVLENARLYEQEEKKRALEKELLAAREVQMNLLPKQLPKIKNFEVAAITIPAKDIGGDFYDVVKIDETGFEIILADVAGKGLPAALLASLGKGVLCTQVLQHKSLIDQLKQANVIIRGSVPRQSFITVLLAYIQSETKELTIVNAGNCYPILYSNETQQVKPIVIKGTALNMTDNLYCEMQTVRMKPNDCIVMYSDGIEEAQNISQEFFGSERISKVIKYYAKESVEILLQKIIEEVKQFSKGVSQLDDITIVVIKATT